MEKMFLITNWFLYSLLFGAFFIKFTDKKARNRLRKIAYGVLMLYCLFFALTLFKSAFMFEPSEVKVKIGIYQTIFNSLIVFFMCTKIVDDNLFKKVRK